MCAPSAAGALKASTEVVRPRRLEACSRFIPAASHWAARKRPSSSSLMTRIVSREGLVEADGFCEATAQFDR